MAAALALHNIGVEVAVYESVRDVRPLGVGINLLPHAMGVMQSLGALDDLLPMGVATGELCFFNRHGQLIWREPRGLRAGYDVPQLSVHRGNLQLTLMRLVRERLGLDSVITDRRLTGFVGDDSGVDVTLQSADGAEFSDRADVLIAADGIHSAVRNLLYPDQGPPHWSGNVLWRATSIARPFLTGRSMFMAGHLSHKFVAYPITEPDADGNCVVNWIAELDRRDVGLGDRESWNRVGNRADFAVRFDNWNFDWLDIPALIAGAETIYEYPMVDRDPLQRWTFGRVTLLGDAAHPMYPIGSNGASQAILDAAALAESLGTRGTAGVSGALENYEAARRPKTSTIVMANRQHGPERVMDMAEQRSPDGFGDITDVFATGELEGISAEYKALAGFSVKPA